MRNNTLAGRHCNYKTCRKVTWKNSYLLLIDIVCIVIVLELTTWLLRSIFHRKEFRRIGESVVH